MQQVITEHPALDPALQELEAEFAAAASVVTARGLARIYGDGDAWCTPWRVERRHSARAA